MVIEIAIGALLFMAGYIFGRLSVVQRLLGIGTGNFLGKPKTSGWKTADDLESNKPARLVDIDESKFVTDVSTDSFTSKHKSLGKTTVSQDDGIGASVSRLKNLKERK